MSIKDLDVQSHSRVNVELIIVLVNYFKGGEITPPFFFYGKNFL